MLKPSADNATQPLSRLAADIPMCSNWLRRIVPNATQTTEKEFSKRFMKATKVKFPAIPATSLTKIPWFYANWAAEKRFRFRKMILSFIPNCLALMKAAPRNLSKGLTCGSCHKESAPQEGSTVDNDRCLSCHGSYEELAKKTQKAEKSDNPHSSHQGKLECSRCHAGHSKTKSYCLECHSNFNQKMPENWLITFSRS